MNWLRRILFTFTLACSAVAIAEPHGSVSASLALDHQTQKVLNSIVDGDWQSAAINAKQLKSRFPNYALGQLLYSETQRVIAGLPPSHATENLYSLNYMALLLEAQARVAQPAALSNSVTRINSVARTNENTQLPAAIIEAGSDVDRVIIVDLSESYLMLYDTTATQPRLLKRHYIASGLGGFDKRIEGDLKTPVGVYRIHGFRSDSSLPTLYGSGALMLDYPNALDKLYGRSGSGIWLHGVPHDQKSRAPRSSEGCVTMANDYLLELRAGVDLQSTQVILSNGIRWASALELTETRERLHELFDQYRKAWIDLNVENLNALYHDSAWPLAAKQHGVNANLKRVSQSGSKPVLPGDTPLDSVDLDSVNLMSVPNADPDAAQVIQMSFRHGVKNEMKTTLYWRNLPTGLWQIIHERREKPGV